ncbi:MAG: hypothetical protein ACRD0G_10360 [Acidimicrobiales bacterium]
MPELAAVAAAVEADVRDGVSHILTPQAFTLVAPTPDATGARIGNDSFTTVVWRLDAVDDKGIDDLWPTHRHVELEGVTIVEHGDGNLDDALFHRYVDWNSLSGQLGASRGRGTCWFRMAHRDDTPPDDPRPPAFVAL